ncbi:ARM repeat-containing protein [Patellaria atrata CBS 101060]|uniref:ARM repeat-containing protein n=1 Tax=Patellaria atrata CBS 101060 TaxID=1346257 RepID=A0A9P4VTK7_9PEZI|nr:ARM repeat-containing protein [Patellaria atrata CBS 101060]
METDSVVELPAAANPLTEGILIQILRSSASTNADQVRHGTTQLDNWRNKSGFHTLLQAVFQEKYLPVEVRYLAIIQLKNGIDTFWRGSRSIVNKDEKDIIRSRLIDSGLNEADRRLALQNALIIGKVVRIDYPTAWPDAIEQVVNRLRASIESGAYHLHLPRILLILHHVIKELSRARLQRQRANLQAIAPEIFHILGQIYIQKVQRWQTFLREGGDDEGGALEDIDQSLITIRVIRRLVISGFEFPHRVDAIREFWPHVRNHLGEFLGFVSHPDSPLSPLVQNLVEKHLMQLAKLHFTMAQTHPASFVLLPDSLDLVRAYWNLIAKYGESFGSKSLDTSKIIEGDGDTDETQGPIESRLSLKGLLILRACFKMIFNPAQTFKYRHANEKEEQKQSTQFIKDSLFTPSFLTEIMEVIVTRFFVIRQVDLAQWQEEPEEWEVKEEGESEKYEFSVKACSEKVFLEVAINYKELIMEPLKNVFYSVASPENNNLQLKESVYSAVGLAAAVIHEHLDFDTFITATLVPEVQIQRPGYNILRRRIAILLGQWIPIKVAEANRPVVYRIFQYLLDKNVPLNDLVVRVTAGRHFSHIANEWEFAWQLFTPFAKTILEALMNLILEVELIDTKMAILNTISVIVERAEHNITPFADAIVSLLPSLWDQSGDQHLMKTAILTILTRLINAMKSESRRFHDLALPIIHSAIEPGSETNVYLQEDALDLWHSILAQTETPPSQALISIFPRIFSLFEYSNENLRQALEITDSYLLLTPSYILGEDIRSQLLTRLGDLLGTLKNEPNGIVCNLLELIIRTADAIGGERAINLLTQDMLIYRDNSVIHKLIVGVMGAYAEWQLRDTGIDKVADAINGIVETDYFSVISRLVLASPSTFLNAMESLVQGTNESPTLPLERLLAEWFHHFEAVADPMRRKLMCLALTRLFGLGRTWAMGRLQDFCTVWTDVIVELTDGADDKSVDSLVWSRPTAAELPDPTTSPEAPEDARRRDLIYSDHVHTVNVIAAVREALGAGIAAAGGEQIFRDEWLVNVDKDVWEAFVKLPGVVG